MIIIIEFIVNDLQLMSYIIFIFLVRFINYGLLTIREILHQNRDLRKERLH